MILKQAEQYAWRVASGAEHPELPWDPPNTSIPVHTYLHPNEVMGYAREDNEWRNLDNLHGLAKDLGAHGMQEPIMIGTNGSHAEIQDGHHRALAAQGLKWDKVPVHVINDPYMDDDDDERAIGPGMTAFLKQKAQH